MFFLIPGHWLGEGVISITGSLESIHYYTKWYVLPMQEEMIRAVQVVEKEGVDDHIINSYCFSNFSESSFLVQMDNEFLGHANAEGIVGGRVIRWEFSSDSPFPGYEQYESIDQDEYRVEAGFKSGDYQTSIEGRIWYSQSSQE